MEKKLSRRFLMPEHATVADLRTATADAAVEIAKQTGTRVFSRLISLLSCQEKIITFFYASGADDIVYGEGWFKKIAPSKSLLRDR